MTDVNAVLAMHEKQKQALLEQFVELREELKEARDQREDALIRMEKMYFWLMDLARQCREVIPIWIHLQCDPSKWVGNDTEAYANGFEAGRASMVGIVMSLSGDILNTVGTIEMLPIGIDPDSLPKIENLKENIINRIAEHPCLYIEEERG